MRKGIKKKSSSIKWQSAPLRFILLYIIVTLFISGFGPVKYHSYNYFSVVLFFLAVLIAITLGYKSIKFPREVRMEKLDTPTMFVLIIVKFSIIFSMFLMGGLLLEGLITQGYLGWRVILNRITKMGETYYESQTTVGNTTFLEYIVNFFGIFKQIAFIGYLVYSHKLKSYRKYFIIMVVVWVLYVVVCVGAQKELGDMIIYTLGVMLIKKAHKVKHLVSKMSVLLACIGTALFGSILLNRANSGATDISSFYREFFYFDYDSIIFKVFGLEGGYAISQALYYVSGGYYGLSQSLTVPFEWTYGLGNSFAFSTYAEALLGIPNMMYETYPLRAEITTGYPALQYWSTMFPWLASDLTYLGSIILMFFIARFYARVWKLSNINGDFVAILLFTRLNVMWMYIQSNNQLMQTLESTIATLLLFAVYIISSYMKYSKYSKHKNLYFTSDSRHSLSNQKTGN